MVFVLEIKGTAVLAFDADNMDDAIAYAANAGEREDLTELQSNGAPLWNGKDDIRARAATEAEADLFEKSREEDWGEEPHADAEDFVVYLVPLDEPEAGGEAD
ncbi:MAG: hypothetical protein ABSA49_13085 [Rhizomicrobium sp.]|jgi:hypothetical protein